ncbi:hypothetical protein LZ554_005484 [Drepanopeziza brunnea f. sp. 'monogermtubi']|nr:hypothetical protein LZ554_005484 [Drepanopeziza brunnea f. sp. 'monogermtubi']
MLLYVRVLIRARTKELISYAMNLPGLLSEPFRETTAQRFVKLNWALGTVTVRASKVSQVEQVSYFNHFNLY